MDLEGRGGGALVFHHRAGGTIGEIRAHAFGSPRGFGSVRVEARIGDVTWRTSVFPLNSGGYLLPVKAEVRCKADIGAGDEVTVDAGAALGLRAAA